MLSMGFEESVESILAAATGVDALQTMMLSATKPAWVRSLEQKYLRKDYVHIDLVGNQKQQAAKSVQHKILYCHWMHKQTIMMDLIKCYGFSGTACTAGASCR
jgi:ATP-dependent RNA helicase DDX21